MSKPIEVGCLAVIIHGRHDVIGMTVIVVGKSDSKHYDWAVLSEKEFPWGGKGAHSKTEWLLRIDDYTEETETQEEEMVV